ncbi:DegT/DnrJ/EryC1/StrS family aminotransferase [Rhodocaloribacter litoris]|uniref:DegT/DnrJ/EryC1/StrS family aminotransferase n=1 Tax=Rhodocaloribacter litoris TaxID=2558931 RepID=UPI001E6387D6|nr:DegT/DnrJ/EryC1/StrS family aminotransferase [Rhodocaloribacter litoris]QXD14165.1 DegT/DnrJ/EryC1/StrS family aminotransferase [Rhodocaloribacter litoris]GIV59964.1 MAG: cell surface polysaccharide biosynthesis protein [Rhodothermaceae bacterium]
MNLQMVDLRGQYLAMKDEMDAALQEVLASTQFINGPEVGKFECELAGYLGGSYVLGVANGTDALQVAFMALGIGPGDEVITPAFTFIATAEAAALLGAVPVFCDIDPKTFNLDPNRLEALITPKTKAIVPVHLFGQPADMDPILEIARRHGLYVVEDNAQAVGATYKGRHTGFIGHVGTLSFFPSKNLGCYGDGGAILTNDEALYHRMRLIANHGSQRKYHNEVVGVNSRLDALQAAVLRVKLRRLDAYTEARRAAADRYDALFDGIPGLAVPYRDPNGRHVFHQYTLRVAPEVPGGRDGLAAHLKARGIPHAIYYPVPLHRLPVFAGGAAPARYDDLPETDRAAAEVLSLPMHTELTAEQQAYIADAVHAYVRNPKEKSPG